MVENIEGLIQIAVLICCVTVSLYRMFVYKSRRWALVSFFLGSYLTGDLYWQSCIFYFGQTPQISVVSDLSWYAALMFLFILIREELESVGYKIVEVKFRSGVGIKWFLPLLGPLFSAVMALYYMRFGAILSNIIYAAIMGVILYNVIWVLLNIKRDTDNKGSERRVIYLSILILINCIGEYGAWTASCFFTGNTITNPYFWFNFLATLSFTAYLIVLPKEVDS